MMGQECGSVWRVPIWAGRNREADVRRRPLTRDFTGLGSSRERKNVGQGHQMSNNGLLVYSESSGDVQFCELRGLGTSCGWHDGSAEVAEGCLQAPSL